jgi:hypothetical protein
MQASIAVVITGIRSKDFAISLRHREGVFSLGSDIDLNGITWIAQFLAVENELVINFAALNRVKAFKATPEGSVVYFTHHESFSVLVGPLW